MARTQSTLSRIGEKLVENLRAVDASVDGLSWLTTIGKRVFYGKSASWVTAPTPKVMVEWEGWDAEHEVMPRYEGTADFRITVVTGDVEEPEREMLDAFADVLRVVGLCGRLDDLVHQVWPVSGDGETEFMQRTGRGEAHLVVRVMYGYDHTNP